MLKLKAHGMVSLYAFITQYFTQKCIQKYHIVFGRLLGGSFTSAVYQQNELSASSAMGALNAPLYYLSL